MARYTSKFEFRLKNCLRVFRIFAFIIVSLSLRSSFAFSQTIDTTYVHELLQRATKIASENPQQSIQQFLEALKQSQKILFTSGQIRSLNGLGDIYSSESMFDSSNYFYQSALKLIHVQKNQMSEAQCNLNIGENFMRLYKSDSALHYLNKSLNLSRDIGDKNFEAGVFNNIANVYLNQNRYEDALTNFIISADLYDSLHNLPGLSKALSNVGNIEYRLGHFDKAIDYAKKSKKYATESDYVSGVGYAYKLLGWIHRKMGEVKSALAYYDSSLTIYSKLNEKRDMAEVALSIGNAQYDLSQYHKAISYYMQCLRSSKTANYQPFIPYAYSGLTSSYFTLNQLELALHYADSLEVTAATINGYLLMDAFDIKSSIFEEQGNHKAALQMVRRYQNLKDSLTAIDNRRALEDAAAKFQSDLKQQEIDQLRNEQELKDSKSYAIQVGAIAVLFLILVIAILIINRFRILNKTKRLLEIERMRNNIARDLHDDIGSALSSINIMSQVALQDKEPSVIQQNFKRIGEQSSRIMESMTDIVWSINPGNDSLEKLIIKMREFAAEMVEPRNIQLHFHATSQDKTLDAEQRKNLFLIFKEALNNAVKYSQCKTVSIDLTLEKHQLKLIIKDDGNGFNVSEKTTGNGLRNMKARAQSLNGSLSIESHLGAGTTVELSLPLHD